jgi:hypothetical protein
MRLADIQTRHEATIFFAARSGLRQLPRMQSPTRILPCSEDRSLGPQHGMRTGGGSNPGLHLGLGRDVVSSSFFFPHLLVESGEHFAGVVDLRAGGRDLTRLDSSCLTPEWPMSVMRKRRRGTFRPHAG